MKWLRHAFAVDAPGPAEPSEAQRAVVEGVCVQIVKRHLSTPAIAFLEMSRPMNFVGAQTMHFFQPFVAALANVEEYRHFAEFLEQRGSIGYICRRIEALEVAAERREAGPDEPPGGRGRSG
jgi:hypothetical protein